jgi:hypothetical protein
MTNINQNLRHLRSSASDLGCTVGVIQIPGGMLFFKNRDLAGEYLRNRTTVWRSTPESHALMGNNLKTGALEGVSIGVNRARICVANTHVVSTADVTYDLLCERLVRDARESRDVPRIVEAFMADHAVQGGRILVSSPGWTFLVEVVGDRFEIEAMEGNLAITNGFSLLAQRVERPAIREQSSASRLQVALGEIGSISSVAQLKGLLRSHVPAKGELSICNHRQDGGGTESSHIIQIQGDYVGWSSLVGYPCENDYQTVELFQG